MKWLIVIGLISNSPVDHSSADFSLGVECMNPPKGKCFINADDVNFHSAPYRDGHNIVGSLDQNDVVYFLSEYTIRDDFGNGVETWYFVRRPNGREGWVYSKFVTC
ncbi:MAG: SH3 domain-containing protein [Flavobacteriales bacterium]